MKILLHKETEFKITLLISISDISTYHLNTYVRKVQIIVRAIRRVSRADGTGSRGAGGQGGIFPHSSISALQVLAGIETKPSPSKCFGLLLAHLNFQTFLWPCVCTLRSVITILSLQQTPQYDPTFTAQCRTIYQAFLQAQNQQPVP